MRWFVTIAIALVSGFAGAAAWDYAGLGPDRTRSALMADPDILPDAMAELQRRDTAKRIAPLRDELTQPYPGAVLGNPQGTVTLVEFSDYACGFCRQSLADINALIEANPDLRVVLREYPVLSPESADAARMALAAADQGKFAVFHEAMFGQSGLSEASIQNAAQAASLDLAAARAAIDSGKYEDQLQNNVFLGQSLRLSGTPAFIVGDEVLNGAVGIDTLREAIAKAGEL